VSTTGYHKRRHRSIDWQSLPRPERVSARIEHDGMVLEISQLARSYHDLEFVLYEVNGGTEYAIALAESDLKDLFYWLSMHLSNVNRIHAGLSPLPIWNGELTSSNVPETQLALRMERS